MNRIQSFSGTNLEKCRRHFARRSDLLDFEEFVATISQRCSAPDLDRAKSVLLEIKEEVDPFLNFIEPITVNE